MEQNNWANRGNRTSDGRINGDRTATELVMMMGSAGQCFRMLMDSLNRWFLDAKQETGGRGEGNGAGKARRDRTIERLIAEETGRRRN
ncbi:hypothetical protein J6590_037360 [Homalodisca vitripennis]|nr:hypothetical protein J6590_037360 [Homalodisca vitripennis]